MSVKPFALTILSLCLGLGAPARAGVVINEIFYHAPGDLDELEYVELLNAGATEVDLSGWKLTGVGYEFPPESKIAPGAYLTLAKNKALLIEFYGVEAFGEFPKALKNGGEKLSLKQADGVTVETVEYSDSAPWPRAADGYSASLERVCPGAPANDPANWLPSRLSDDHQTKPSGTPGKANDNHSPAPTPAIQRVTFSPETAAPGATIEVRAELAKGVDAKLEMLYRLAKPGVEEPEVTVEMKASTAGVFAASIPTKEPGIVRFRVRATAKNGAVRLSPPESEIRPAYSALVISAVELGKIPAALLVHVGAEEHKRGEAYRKSHGQARGRGFGPGGPRMTEEDMLRMTATERLNPGNLQKLWADLTLTQDLDASKRIPLAAAFRAAGGELAALRKETEETTDIRAFSDGLEKRIEAVMTKLKTACEGQVKEEQFAALTPPAPADRGRGRGGFGRRMDPRMMLQRTINVEESWLEASTLPGLNDEQWFKLLAAHREARKKRDALLPQDGEMDFGLIFENAEEHQRTLREAVTQAVGAKLAVEYSAKVEANPGPFGGMRFGGPRGIGGSTPAVPLPAQGRSAFVYVDLATREPKLFDFINVTERKSGLKVRFHKDRPFRQMTALNVLYEGNERAILNEALAYELYREAGNAAPLAEYVRLSINGELAGYHLAFEQPNGAFLRRNEIDDRGNLYKLIWMGSHRPSKRTPPEKLTQRQDIVGRHEKKTHVHDGYEDVVGLVEALEQTKDSEAMWKLIQEKFDVDQVATYFAVNALLSHWDGFFNNYFLYHDTEKTGKWTMYPWDQDNTWGAANFGNSDDLVSMPLNFGAEGAAPPGVDPEEAQRRQNRGAGRGRGFGFGRGGPGWWRDGGDISRPLLANPEFRRVYLAKIKHLAETVFTQEKFGPKIDAMRETLEPEVRLRAETHRRDPNGQSDSFHEFLDGFERHLTERRAWLLEQKEVQEAKP